MNKKDKRISNSLGRRSLSRIEKIKLKGGATSWDDKGFLKTVRHAKGSDLKYEKMVTEKSGPCERYVDLSLKKVRIKGDKQ